MSSTENRIISKPLNDQPLIVADEFQVVEPGTADSPAAIPVEGKVLVHLSAWEANKAELSARAQAGELGVYLNPEDNPEQLQDDVKVLKLIAFNFPVFKYGQGYSGAVLLRTRYGFTGDIRAFGDIWRDQFFFLARCGFTQFDIKEGKSLEDALNAFADFTIPYQTSADGSLPVFNRRAAAVVTSAEKSAGTSA